MSDERNEPQDDHVGAEGEEDKDTLPGAPGKSDTPLGDTDQHSDVPSPPAQTGG